MIFAIFNNTKEDAGTSPGVNYQTVLPFLEAKGTYLITGAIIKRRPRSPIYCSLNYNMFIKKCQGYRLGTASKTQAHWGFKPVYVATNSDLPHHLSKVYKVKIKASSVSALTCKKIEGKQK